MTEEQAERVAQIKKLFPDIAPRTSCDYCNVVRPLEDLRVTERERLVCVNDEACSALVAELRSARFEAMYRESVERAGLYERSRISTPSTRRTLT